VLVGDVLLEFDGHNTSSPEQLMADLFGAGVGRQVPLKILRGGTVSEVTVTVGERPVHH
jgi:S1-C subfamily serine protease